MLSWALPISHTQMDREPELKKSSGAPLCRSVLFEQALGFAVLAVVSVLGTWPPAIHHHKVEDQAVRPVVAKHAAQL
jgi:putative copper export protein